LSVGAPQLPLHALGDPAGVQELPYPDHVFIDSVKIIEIKRGQYLFNARLKVVLPLEQVEHSGFHAETGVDPVAGSCKMPEVGGLASDLPQVCKFDAFGDNRKNGGLLRGHLNDAGL
jgi:hypothetical protein